MENFKNWKILHVIITTIIFIEDIKISPFGLMIFLIVINEQNDYISDGDYFYINSQQTNCSTCGSKHLR